jgi:hypothetical protein
MKTSYFFTFDSRKTSHRLIVTSPLTLQLRPHLRASLQLLTMTLPRSFIHSRSDRMSCGLAIILRASYQYFEHHQEWSFMNDMLDALAHYETSRVFVFDGIASTVEYAMPNFNPNVSVSTSGLVTDSSVSNVSENEAVSTRPCLSVEACDVLSRILTRFVLGYYHGDQALMVPAMLCLEKVYCRKVEILLSQKVQLISNKSDDDTTTDGTMVPNNFNVCTSVPDKELWQNIAVAIYSVCRSSDPDSSTVATKCFRRIVIGTGVDQIPANVWITILYLMVHKQPTIVSEVSRANVFSLLGQLLLRILPSLSHNPEHRDDLEEFVLQFSALAEENVSSSSSLLLLSSSASNYPNDHPRHRRAVTSIMFDKTIQTLTYICNHIISDEWDGDPAFTVWMNEILLSPLEIASSHVNGHGKVVTTFDNSQELDDVSEISDSVAGDEY